MDGNGRWAKEHNLPRIKGHERGVESVEEAVKGCLEFGIKYLTLYAFSIENWKRPKTEIKVLMNYLSKYLDDKVDMIMKNQIRFKVIGRIQQLNQEIQDKIERNINITKDNNKLTFTLALSYSGRSEIIDAVKKICNDVKIDKVDLEEINEGIFSNYLGTCGMPDPDLLIRTSGEMRISNFLLWQISYTELYFTNKYWPDFNKDELREAIESYKKRERRFGKVNGK